MTHIAIDCTAILLGLLCLHRLKAAPGGEIHEDYLSAQSGVYLRGLLALVVVFHHLAQNGGRGVVLFPLFAKVGYLTVSVFFFLSGYGLMKQHMSKPNYSHRFLRRRLPAVLVPYGIATVLYWALYRFLGDPWTLREILLGLVQGTPIVVASWYIVCIVLFYIAFRVLMGLCGTRYGRMIWGGLLYCGIYVALCRELGYGSWWYNTAPVLVLGMFWAWKEARITAFFRKRYALAAPGVLGLFAAVYVSKILLNSRLESRMLSVALTWLVAALFACSVMVLLMKLKLGSPVLRRLGEISLEIYLCHYLFILLFSDQGIFVKNEAVYVLLVTVCSLLFAGLLHRVCLGILKGSKKEPRG